MLNVAHLEATQSDTEQKMCRTWQQISKQRLAYSIEQAVTCIQASSLH